MIDSKVRNMNPSLGKSISRNEKSQFIVENTSQWQKESKAQDCPSKIVACWQILQKDKASFCSAESPSSHASWSSWDLSSEGQVQLPCVDVLGDPPVEVLQDHLFHPHNVQRVAAVLLHHLLHRSDHRHEHRGRHVLISSQRCWENVQLCEKFVQKYFWLIALM